MGYCKIYYGHGELPEVLNPSELQGYKIAMFECKHMSHNKRLQSDRPLLAPLTAVDH